MSSVPRHPTDAAGLLLFLALVWLVLVVLCLSAITYPGNDPAAAPLPTPAPGWP